jgi:hypothetical protein
MDWVKYTETRQRYDMLIRWEKEAKRYFARYGDSGNPDTRNKHKMQQAEAERDLPALKKLLINSWRTSTKKNDEG